MSPGACSREAVRAKVLKRTQTAEAAAGSPSPSGLMLALHSGLLSAPREGSPPQRVMGRAMSC